MHVPPYLYIGGNVTTAGERSLYKVYEARPHSQCVYILWAMNDCGIDKRQKVDK